MSKPLFEFVKVAAGDRFRWESGNYSFVEGQLNLDNVVNSSWIANEPVNIDTWFLRPVEWAEFIHPHTRALREILAILKDAPSNASAVLAVMQEAASALESLRPAESPDAGREAYIDKVVEVMAEDSKDDRKHRLELMERTMRLNWPETSAPEPIEYMGEGRDETINQRVKRALGLKKMSQSDFAKLMGVQPSMVTRWLKDDHNFTVKTLYAIEEKLQIKLISIVLDGHPRFHTVGPLLPGTPTHPRRSGQPGGGGEVRGMGI